MTPAAVYPTGEGEVKYEVGLTVKGWYWGRSDEGRPQVCVKGSSGPLLLDMPRDFLPGDLRPKPRRKRTWVVATVERLESGGKVLWDVRVFYGLRALVEADFLVGGRRSARR